MASVNHPKFLIEVKYPNGDGPNIKTRRPTEEEAERARRMLSKQHPQAVVRVTQERR